MYKIYAAYGSNMNIAQMAKRCPDAVLLGNGILQDYQLTFCGKRNGVANIERKEGSVVPIVLWNITERCERTLDAYEGVPMLYHKEEIQVQTKHSKAIITLAYVMNRRYRLMPMIPSKEYFETIKIGYKENNLEEVTLDDALTRVCNEVWGEIGSEIRSGKGSSSA